MHDLQELVNLSGDALAKYLWKGNEQFASLFNAMVYKRQQLDPSSLQEMDTDLSTLIADKDLLETVRRVRDVVKMASDGATYQILAVENQQAVHYGMAFRCALYDRLRQKPDSEKATG